MMRRLQGSRTEQEPWDHLFDQARWFMDQIFDAFAYAFASAAKQLR